MAFVSGDLVKEEAVDIVPLQVLGDVGLHVSHVAFAVQRVHVTNNLDNQKIKSSDIKFDLKRVYDLYIYRILYNSEIMIKFEVRIVKEYL